MSAMSRTPRSGFSNREIEVLELASQGMTNPQIAKRLELSVHAIKFHLASIYRKLGAANRTEAAVAWALTMNGHGEAADRISTPPAA
jgi:DNA-binding NarL/FixJ family response regulator